MHMCFRNNVFNICLPKRASDIISQAPCHAFKCFKFKKKN